MDKCALLQMDLEKDHFWESFLNAVGSMTVFTGMRPNQFIAAAARGVCGILK